MATEQINQLTLDTTNPTLSTEFRWPTAHASTGDLIFSMIQSGGPQTDGTANPKIVFGFNSQANGALTDTTIPYGATFNIEGHWDSDGAGTYLMEGYLEFNDSSATYQAIRPFMSTYDLASGEINLCKFTIGENALYTFNYHTAGLASGNTLFAMGRTGFTHSSQSTGGIYTLAAEGGNIIFRFAPDGTSAATVPYMQFTCAPLGGSSQHSYTTWLFSDGVGAAAQVQKVGRLVFRADENIDSVTMQIGSNTGGVQDAMFEISSENANANMATYSGIALASQTGPLLRYSGNSNAGLVEAKKVQLYPKGHWAYRESGNTTTDRIPTATAPAGGTNKYFPMLDEVGALYYITGAPA